MTILKEHWQGLTEIAHKRYGAYPLYNDDDCIVLQFTRSHDNDMQSFLMTIESGHKYIVNTSKKQVTIYIRRTE